MSVRSIEIFGGKLGLMQGIIVTPSSDAWSVGLEKNQLVYFPKGDLAKAKLLCEGDSAEPCKSVTVFYGMAKPVRAPQIGPAQAP